MVTMILLQLYYCIRFPFDSRARSASKAKNYNKNRHTILILVFLMYLGMSSLNQYYRVPKSAYEVMELGSFDFDKTKLKQNYRKLSLQFHPDKYKGRGVSYIEIRDSYEILIEDSTRYIYDRFGKNGLACMTCITVSEYFWHGMQANSTWYFMAISTWVIFKIIGLGMRGGEVRWLGLFLTAVVEISLIIHSPSGHIAQIVNAFLPQKTVSDQIDILHYFYYSIVFFSHYFAQMYYPIKAEIGTEQLSIRILNEALRIHEEVALLAKENITFCKKDPVLCNRLEKELGEIAVENELFDDTEQVKAYSAALDRLLHKRNSRNNKT